MAEPIVRIANRANEGVALWAHRPRARRLSHRAPPLPYAGWFVVREDRLNISPDTVLP